MKGYFSAMDHDRKAHWENIYRTKKRHEAGWYQPVPSTSLEQISLLDIDPGSRIIDVGGGDSALADHLLDNGFTNLTVLDISLAAIERAQARLGKNAGKIKWIVSDIVRFNPPQTYDVWHDRAAFHFLTSEEEINTYVRTVSGAVRPGGYFIIGTFSDRGPTKCSGLDITQYASESLCARFAPAFRKVRCFSPDHITPGGVIQHYTFCCFQRQELPERNSMQ